ncbi:hypothetical protein CIN_06900 [Commensalibacter intestini A911]|uniref:Uncharacterized protein n=5 Tax=Commensalibacter intestini TaxID=479936 RepID=G6EZ20_9PROT|nr:hypothetical protein CIN_06900 [Commensalibacter intestini A911]
MLCSIAIILLLISLYLKLNLANADDHFFFTATQQSTVINFLEYRYENWTGRIPIEAITILTIQYSFVWKFIAPFCLLLIAISISRIVCNKIILFYVFLSLLLMLAMPYAVGINTVLWLTGVYFYILPLSLCFYTMSVFVAKRQRKIEIVLSFIFTFYFSYMEQIAIFFIFICAVWLFLQKDLWTKINIPLLVSSIINFIVSVTAPGNYSRYRAETWSWFPDYTYYSMIQKFSFGFDKFHQLLILHWNVTFIFLLILMIYLYFMQGTRSIAGHLSTFIGMIFIVFSILYSCRGKIDLLGRFFFNRHVLDADKWSSLSTYLSYLFVMLLGISVCILMLSSIKNKHCLWIVMSLFFIGIMDTLIMGFSPTVYASGLRVDFIFEVCCVVICIFVIDDLFLCKSNVMNIQKLQ